MKKTVCFFLCLIFIFSFSCVASAEGKPSLSIKTEDELIAFFTGTATKYEKAVLENDITVKENYSPHNLSCLFDGKGHSIILKNKSTTLFSEITEDATIKNLIIKGQIGNKAGEAAAGICVTNNGNIENCAVTADISGKNSLYGICQINNGKIYNCAVLGEPNMKDNPSYYWIPIAAENNGDITACYYIGEYVKDIEVEGRALTEDECKNGKLPEELNARVDANEGMMRWIAKDGKFPDFYENHSANSSVTIFIVIALVVLFAAAGVICFLIFSKKKKQDE